MRHRHPATVTLRGICVLVAVYALAAALWRLVAGPLAGVGFAGMAFEDALLTACALGLTLSVGWLCVVTTAVVAEVVLTGSARSRACPLPIRRLILLGCGVALSAGFASPAVADIGDVAADTVPLTGLTVPDRATGPAEVTVRRGDSLWSLAAHSLPSDAGDSAVADAWHSLYRRNAARIGADPDLILPGTTLQLPGTVTTQRKDPR